MLQLPLFLVAASCLAFGCRVYCTLTQLSGRRCVVKWASSLGHLGANAADNRWMDSRIGDLSCNHINNGRQNPMKLGSGVNPGFAATDLNCMLIKEIGVRVTLG